MPTDNVQEHADGRKPPAWVMFMEWCDACRKRHSHGYVTRAGRRVAVDDRCDAARA